MGKEKKRNASARREPSWQVSLVPFIVLTLSLVVVIRIFGADALSGGSQVCLLLASAVTAAISMFAYRNSWEVLEDCILDNIRSVGSAVLILLLIGAIAGTWMVSGIVPAMICYGMKVIFPSVFLAAACAISALISVMTGSSWTTIATIGVALIGIGTAQGFDPGWTAGAIVSGAYFGDKVSPLSDTTVLASSSTGTPLFTHIRYMMVTTVPSLTIAMVIFLTASIFHHSSGVSQTAEFSQSLRSAFHITPWLLAVPVLTGIMIVRKVPAILTLFCAALMAAVAALVFQPQAGEKGGKRRHNKDHSCEKADVFFIFSRRKKPHKDSQEDQIKDDIFYPCIYPFHNASLPAEIYGVCGAAGHGDDDDEIPDEGSVFNSQFR